MSKIRVDVARIKKYQKILNLLRNPKKVKAESMILLNRFIKSLTQHDREMLEYNKVFIKFHRLAPDITSSAYTVSYNLWLGRIEFDLSGFQDAALGSDLDITLDKTFKTIINGTGYSLKIFAYHQISEEEELLLRQIGVIRTIKGEAKLETVVQCELPDSTTPAPTCDGFPF